jgi:hypothetical protein
MRKALPIVALLVLSFLAVKYASSQADKTLYGYISCSMCGEKGATDSHRDCMEKCLAKGAGVVIVTDNDHYVIPIENPDKVVGHHAHRVALFGYSNGKAFHVVSVRFF